MNEDTVTKAIELVRPDYRPGDLLRRKGTQLVGAFLGWHDRWPGYLRVRCPGAYTRIEPARDWERI